MKRIARDAFASLDKGEGQQGVEARRVEAMIKTLKGTAA